MTSPAPSDIGMRFSAVGSIPLDPRIVMKVDAGRAQPHGNLAGTGGSRVGQIEHHEPIQVLRFLLAAQYGFRNFICTGNRDMIVVKIQRGPVFNDATFFPVTKQFSGINHHRGVGKVIEPVCDKRIAFRPPI